ncbi:uncharacterized protein HRG_04497 [Hirsutella rhossiliensis]|uniref:DUF8035 domain-containing protein n=1 Tax=Hirsutella rhossiliensis TaxID=111463 RepID=A0A9P8SJC5_9HYPO|nr:uncharacterized protein HRG_04497 [Hirsutella rhossiliensis]KAH0964069.1 hypothetical protein HRG_04497 [Hirsutella rhossiliensis]
MTDRYRASSHAAAGRSSTFNPARSSMPTSIGYSSIYAGDMHVVPSATPRHHVTTPRAYATSSSSTASATPTTTRTYAVAPDPRQRSTTRETGRARRSTLDSASRPPVIITTTTQKDRPHASSSHTSNTRSGSPIRDDYRASDGQFYAQPASSIRSRSTARPYHVATAADDSSRFRDRGEAQLSHREVEAYRSSRPSVAYPSDPRHSTAAIDYGDDGYQYTNAGELARYDLDLPKSSRPRRQESVDRGYYRPNINYNADQRSFNVNTSHDLSRNYNMNTSRPYDGRAGPPPSTRGFDRISRAYEPARDLPPAAPVPPSPTGASSLLEPPSDRWESGRRSRPLSLHQDGAPRSSHHDEYQRSRDDERRMREHREREPNMDRPYEPSRFKDESIASRGFGIRTDALEGPGDARERRREPRSEEPKRRMDETVVEERHERRESRREDEGADKERSRLREKVAAGLSVAATAIGLAPTVMKEEDKKDQGAREPRRRRSPGEDNEWRREPGLPERAPVPAKDREQTRAKEASSRDGSRTSTESADRPRRTARRHQSSGGFDPNDASDLRQLKEQLAAMDDSDRGANADRGDSAEEERQQSPSSPSTRRRGSSESTTNRSRERELAIVSTGTKQVRVVSPPREKSEEKPLKGILKQPSARFPEETNPVREGVAPHKEDKKLKDAPQGARWTKINRKIVNPEALTVGKERFEVRDDFVIVLRVLSKEEIQAYASATQVLRERRRNKSDGDREQDRDQDDEGSRRHHRSHRHKDEDEQDGEEKDRERERERRRRHRRDGEDEYEARSRDSEHHHPRSFRERDRGAEA